MTFKDYIYNKDSFNNSYQECPICFEILENTLVRETPCGHIFHLDCIKSQFASVHKNRFSCSMCRYDLFNYITNEEMSKYCNDAVDLRNTVERININSRWGSEIVDSLIRSSILINVNPETQSFNPYASPSSSSETSEDSPISEQPLQDEGVLGYLSSLWTRIFGNRDEEHINTNRVQERAEQRVQQWAREWSLEQQQLRSQQNNEYLRNRIGINSPLSSDLDRHRINIHS